MYPYDPEMARSLLAQTGYAGGLELTILTTDYEPYMKTAQVLKEQWKKVGVELKIEVRVFDDIEIIICGMLITTYGPGAGLGIMRTYFGGTGTLFGCPQAPTDSGGGTRIPTR